MHWFQELERFYPSKDPYLHPPDCELTLREGFTPPGTEEIRSREGGREGWGRGEAEPSPGPAPVLLGWSPAPSSTGEQRLGLQVSWGILRMVKLAGRPDLTQPAIAPEEDTEGCHSGCS